MAQEVQAMGGRERDGGVRIARTNSMLISRTEEKPRDTAEGAFGFSMGPSSAILAALGDESSRRILGSAIATGKTVEEISAEQNLPLSTCYRRMRSLLSGGLMILEKTVVTPTGKRYAIYRTSFSKTAIRFNGEEIAVEVTPNMDIIDKLRRRWLSANYPSQNQDDRLFKGKGACPGPANQLIDPFG
jgi:hypothetical protein